MHASLWSLQVTGLVGSARKRTLLLWQAVEFSRTSERPNLATLQACPAKCLQIYSAR